MKIILIYAAAAGFPDVLEIPAASACSYLLLDS